MKANLICIMSSERSGSNLLRKLLIQHSRISGPRAPHLLRTFWDIEKFYEPLSDDRNGSKLFEHMCRVVNHPLHDWKFSMDFGSFKKTYRPGSFLDYFNAFYYEQQSARKADYIVCKENNIFDYYNELKSYFQPGIKFVYLCRDPRDYVASWMNVPLGYDTPRKAVRCWIEEQRKCIALLEDKGGEILTVRYEDIISDTAGVLAGVLSHVGADEEKECFALNDNSADPEEAKNKYWQNLNKPVMKNNTGNYAKMFSKQIIFEIERLSARQMKRLGYNSKYSAFEKLYCLFRHYWNVISNRHVFNRPMALALEDNYTEKILKDRMDLAKSIRNSVMLKH